MARILVLDGHSSAALAFTRSAGRAGHWVAVGANAGIFASAKASRYCQLRFDYPVSTDDAAAFIESTLKFVRNNAIDLVIPITDWTLQPLSQEREAFQGVTRIALPPPDAIEAASDKYRTIEIARKLGIAVPPTWFVTSASDSSTLPDLTFPVVVKDRFSTRWKNGKAITGSVTYAQDRRDLERKIEGRLQVAGDVIVQQFVSGAGVGFSCFIANEEVSLPFAWKRIREVDPKGSASSCRESVTLDPSLEAASTQLIREIGFQGIAMVEYKVPVGGSPVLMEINGRPWGSIALPIASGIDYPRYLIDWCLTGALPPKSVAYRAHIVCRRVVGELNHLRNVRKGPPEHWPGEYPTFWSTLARVAIPWYPGMHYDELWLSDLKPGVSEVVNWFRARLRR